MVHYQAELATALARMTPLVVISSSQAISSRLSRTVATIAVDTGQNAASSLVRALNPMSWIALRRELQKKEVDILHIVGVHEWNPALAILSKGLRRPLAYTVHDPESHPGAPIFIRFSNWIAIRMADAVVVLTARGRDQLVRTGIRAAKIHHIPMGIFSTFRALRQNRRRARIEREMLYFGRIEPYKGLDVLAAAFERACPMLPGWKLVVAGNGRLPASLAQADPRRVRILNRYISDSEAARLMRRARVVVLPYTAATQSGVIPMAYAFGRPVITTAVGGLREMLIPGKTGLVVPPNDVEALAKAMIALGTDRRRLSRMGKYASEFGRRKWSWDGIAGAHIRMYAKLLAGAQKT
jgi:glycosyltransferase involved in cell wall biosynthesis